MSTAGFTPKQSVYTVRNRDRQSTLATQVTIAGTSRDRRTGLKGRVGLPSDAGLWIAPCEAIHTFGMRMAIDAVFLDQNFRVRKIRSGIAPRRIAFCIRAHSVLELAAGAASRSLTCTGDQLEFCTNGEA